MNEIVFDLTSALQRPDVRRSLALNTAIVEKILEYDDVAAFLRRALENSLRILPKHPTDPWLAEWCDLLSDATGPDGSKDKVKNVFSVILEETEHGINMRQSVYFGEPVLSYNERMIALRSVRYNEVL